MERGGRVFIWFWSPTVAAAGGERRGEGKGRRRRGEEGGEKKGIL